MRRHRPTKGNGKWMASRLLVIGALALALAMGIAGASSALAAPARAGHGQTAVRGDAVTTTQPPAGDAHTSGDDGVSPVVPLVFAGIVILAASSQWMPSSRYVYRLERRWW